MAKTSARRQLARLLRLVGRAMIKAGYHSRPAFLGIGAQKCGTTSLYNYLIAHPDIRGARRKEVHYFDDAYEKGIDWYWAQFHLPRPGKPLVTGEMSPYYLFHPEVPARVAQHLPSVKLIAMLRNPIDRAFSQYQHQVARGPVPEHSFDEVVATELRVIEREGVDWFRQVKDPAFQRYYSYVSRGLYALQLRRWFDYFPRESFCIIKSEDFFASPEAVTRTVLRFLGVDPARYARTDFPVYNPGRYLTGPTDRFREQLLGFYRPFNEELAELLNMDLSDWE